MEREYLGGEIVFQVEENQNFPEIKIRNTPEEIRADEWIVLSLDEETKRKFGPPGSEGKATLAVSNYKIQYGPMEISDHTQLNQVVNIKINNETAVKESSKRTPKIKWLRFDSEGYPSERALIKKEYETEIKEIERGDYGNVNELGIAIALEDLNGDGKDEVVVALFHPYFSGYRANCLLQIYTMKDEKLDQQFPLSNANLIVGEQGDQQEVGVIDNPELQWKDIVVNRNLWRWDGEKYE
ncbi:FG-GAP repeat protein [Paenibacillus tyrfis]|uniref:FG-GAP repeat protein n=1 Tax=Paenibacillus tyrfis TaxID=1501230 RepID=UPI0020A0012C|nr:FG-GAP repeat protein [Paenibacillus tyrfis]MCP1311471.1 FG-GAP repeat protein [Paenibacillus tyrfis]